MIRGNINILFLITVAIIANYGHAMNIIVENNTDDAVGIEIISRTNNDAYIFTVLANDQRTCSASDRTYQLFYLHSINDDQDPEVDKIKWLENPRLCNLVILGSSFIHITKKEGAFKADHWRIR